jgi:hypothetical protein
MEIVQTITFEKEGLEKVPSGAQPTGRKAMPFGGLRCANPPYRKAITKQPRGLGEFEKQSHRSRLLPVRGRVPLP